MDAARPCSHIADKGTQAVDAVVGKGGHGLVVCDVLRARHGRRDFLEHPSVPEIHARRPEDLLEWFERVVIIDRDPLTIHCGPIEKSDRGYFEIWRHMRDLDAQDFEHEYPNQGHGATMSHV